MENRKKIEDLEHQLLRQEMQAGFEALNDAIKSGFKNIRLENEAQNKASIVQREEILEKQDITNGRVKALEKVTSTIKFLQENKKIAGLVFYAIYNILEVTTVENIAKAYQWLKLII